MNDVVHRLIVDNEPPPELIEYYERLGLPPGKARNNARKLWMRTRKIENFRAIYADLFEAVKKRAEREKGDISVLAQWNYFAMGQAMMSDDQKIIVTLTEMLRRANGHDASTVKHMRQLPDSAQLLKWKQELIDAGIVDPTTIEPKQIEAVVVSDAANNGNR